MHTFIFKQTCYSLVVLWSSACVSLVFRSPVRTEVLCFSSHREWGSPVGTGEARHEPNMAAAGCQVGAHFQ